MNPISRAAAAVALAFAITTPALALEIQAQAPAAKPPAKPSRAMLVNGHRSASHDR